MKVLKIKKKNGKKRLIYCPNRGEKQKLRRLLPELNVLADKYCNPQVVHGFAKNRSPVTNALQHQGKTFTTCFDLADFFDSITPEHISLPEHLQQSCFVANAPRQGLPTSPVIANIAAAKLDRAILLFIQPLGIVYTRYADDLAFSYDDPQLTAILKTYIPQIVAAARFKINPAKTRTQKGRRIITGVAVDEKVHPTRKLKRKLRAARHQQNQAQVQGLEAWINYVSSQGETQSQLEKDLILVLKYKVKLNKRSDFRFTSEDGFSEN